MAELSIIIVSFNTRQELENCLSSLATHPPTVSHEIVVVDNASSDGTPEAVRSRWPRVRLIDAGANVGFAAANNRGIKAVASEFVVLLNSDTLVPVGALDTLVAALRSDPGAAAAGPRLSNADGVTELSFGRMMGPLNEARQKLLVSCHRRGLPPVAGLVEGMTRRPQRPDWLSGACLLVRREDALAAGLLDERYFLYAEDVDFCAALRALGKHLLFVPDAHVTHLRGASGRARPEATERAYRASQVAFYEKHHPRAAWLLRTYLRLRGRGPG
jgi:N-acetylglucosaminyl-diphospho-decaprenol L-rhamnosyltransferase